MKDLKRRNLKCRHLFVFLIILTIVLAILTHLIPAGEYTRVDNVPIAGTYTQVNSNHREFGMFCPHQCRDFVAQLILFCLYSC